MAFNLILFYVVRGDRRRTTLLVVVQSNPVYSVLLLIGSFIGLAGLYVLLDAPFVAVIQIIVYAGAIMVLFLFVVMLLNAPREEIVHVGHARVWRHARAWRPAGDRVCGRAGVGAQPIAHAGHDAGTATGRPTRFRRSVSGCSRITRSRSRRRRSSFSSPWSARSSLSPERVILVRNESPGQMAELNHYLILSGVLFTIGTAGVLLRRNVITVLLSIEVMLNAVNLTFIAFGHFLGSSDGQIIVFFVITVAAAEAAVGLALVIALFRHVETLNPDAFRQLRG